MRKKNTNARPGVGVVQTAGKERTPMQIGLPPHDQRKGFENAKVEEENKMKGIAAFATEEKQNFEKGKKKTVSGIPFGTIDK